MHGDFKAEKIYDEDAAVVAGRFETEGASRIHVVDLDGALKGEPKNLKSVEAILRTVRTPIEVGGGIRSLDTAKRYLGMGVRWVIFGTKACLDQGFLREAVAEFRDRAIIGIDALDGHIATDGWTKVTPIKAVDLALQVQAAGGSTVIYTDISKDGALKGPNVQEIDRLSGAVTLDVIASGGIGSLADLKALLALKRKNLSGVIIGKALYEKKFSVGDAVTTCLQKG